VRVDKKGEYKVTAELDAGPLTGKILKKEHKFTVK